MLNSILVQQQVNSNSIQHSLTDTITGNSPNSRELLWTGTITDSADLTDAITHNIYRVTNELCAEGLIPTDYAKTMKLVSVVHGVKLFKGDSKSASPTSSGEKPKLALSLIIAALFFLTILLGSKHVKLNYGFMRTTGMYNVNNNYIHKLLFR